MRSHLHPAHLKILIPCYNCEAYIAQCLESIRLQDFDHWTVYIADDASTDDTAREASAFLSDRRFALHSNGNRKYLMGNTLSGLKSMDIAPNDVIVIVDGDDYLMPGALSRIWEQHCAGFDFVYADEALVNGVVSIGKPLISSVPVRQQLWSITHPRSFKGYLYLLLPEPMLKDKHDRYFRAAGDLSLCFPMIEMVGPEKTAFISDKLYAYRNHANCNHSVFRSEQHENIWFLRNQPSLPLQTTYFDVVESVTGLEKSVLRYMGSEVRKRYPKPFSVCLTHVIDEKEKDAWRAYHNLWIDEGIFLKGTIPHQ